MGGGSRFLAARPRARLWGCAAAFGGRGLRLRDGRRGGGWEWRAAPSALGPDSPGKVSSHPPPKTRAPKVPGLVEAPRPGAQRPWGRGRRAVRPGQGSGAAAGDGGRGAQVRACGHGRGRGRACPALPGPALWQSRQRSRSGAAPVSFLLLNCWQAGRRRPVLLRQCRTASAPPPPSRPNAPAAPLPGFPAPRGRSAPARAECFFECGALYQKNRDYRRATREFERATSLDASNVQVGWPGPFALLARALAPRSHARPTAYHLRTPAWPFEPTQTPQASGLLNSARPAKKRLSKHALNPPTRRRRLPAAPSAPGLEHAGPVPRVDGGHPPGRRRLRARH